MRNKYVRNAESARFYGRVHLPATKSSSAPNEPTAALANRMQAYIMLWQIVDASQICAVKKRNTFAVVVVVHNFLVWLRMRRRESVSLVAAGWYMVVLLLPPKHISPVHVRCYVIPPIFRLREIIKDSSAKIKSVENNSVELLFLSKFAFLVHANMCIRLKS